jgi:hypothetical protein
VQKSALLRGTRKGSYGVRCGAKILGDQLLRVDGELRYFPDIWTALLRDDPIKVAIH